MSPPISTGVEQLLTLQTFLDFLWKLAKSYVLSAWPFFIAHLFVIFLIFYDSWYKKIRREIRVLNSWRPGNYVATTMSGSAAEMLYTFVKECKTLGKRGTFVSMADFSDRLDSLVDGLVSELHDRINLLLIIGIAGTFYAFFEFAARWIEKDQNTQIIELLVSSMSKAFPVGFAGLFLAFAFHVWSGRPEGRLRQAIGAATRRALEERHQLTRSPEQIFGEEITRLIAVLEPLTKLDETLTKQLQPVILTLSEKMDQNLGATKDALKPIEQMSETISKGLRPVVEEFGRRLDTTLGLVAKQFENLQKVSQSLIENIQSIGVSVVSLDAISNELKGLLANVPAVLLKLRELEEAHIQTFGKFQRELTQHAERAEGIATGLERALNSVGRIPDEFAAQAEKALTGLNDRCFEQWKGTTETFGQSVQGAQRRFITDMADHTSEIRKNLGRAAEDLQRVSMTVENVVKKPIEELFNNLKAEISADLKTLDDVLARRYPDVKQDLQELTKSLRQSADLVGTINGLVSARIDEVNKTQAGVLAAEQQLLKLLTQIDAESQKLGGLNRAELLGQFRQILKSLNELIEISRSGGEPQIRY